MAVAQYYGTGRRKSSVARVRLVPGTGKITVNKKDVEEYIPHADLRLVINQPFAVTSTAGSYDVFVNSDFTSTWNQTYACNGVFTASCTCILCLCHYISAPFLLELDKS